MLYIFSYIFLLLFLFYISPLFIFKLLTEFLDINKRFVYVLKYLGGFLFKSFTTKQSIITIYNSAK